MKLLRSAQGSFTVEASLVFPVILLLTVILIFLSLLVYQKSAVTLLADRMAQRSASQWDNSNRLYHSGEFLPGRYDGLYWRNVQDDEDGQFQFLIPGSSREIQLDTKEGVQADTLPQKKLGKSAANLPAGVHGRFSYHNGLFSRSVSVHLYSKMANPGILEPWFGQGAFSGEAKAYITEPVEFIRSVDLVRTYMPYIQHYVKRSKLQQIMNRFASKPSAGPQEAAMAFRTHADAKQFLQNTVGGKGTSFSTVHTGEWRMIDALDTDQVAHQAYIGYQGGSKALKDQLEKDAELLADGKVKGVVWHFFKKDGIAKAGLSPSLQKLLESRGIIVVLHTN
ncbi:TadE/TadG family type IV pilus assembly protein [Paenibacillus gansuensis]|uniref:TadE/TadG family type IV pilus assembly protein n=1 Tax=Paenibacillus gansuensis TaxID=306542 RepID=A0ABW5PB39_9BACL